MSPYTSTERKYMRTFKKWQLLKLRTSYNVLDHFLSTFGPNSVTSEVWDSIKNETRLLEKWNKIKWSNSPSVIVQVSWGTIALDDSLDSLERFKIWCNWLKTSLKVIFLQTTLLYFIRIFTIFQTSPKLAAKTIALKATRKAETAWKRNVWGYQVCERKKVKEMRWTRKGKL